MSVHRYLFLICTIDFAFLRQLLPFSAHRAYILSYTQAQSLHIRPVAERHGHFSASTAGNRHALFHLPVCQSLVSTTAAEDSAYSTVATRRPNHLRHASIPLRRARSDPWNRFIVPSCRTSYMCILLLVSMAREMFDRARRKNGRDKTEHHREFSCFCIRWMY